MTILNQINKPYETSDKSDFTTCQRILEELCSQTKMRYGLIRKKDGAKWGNWCVYDYHSQQIVDKNSDTYVKIYQEIRTGFSPIYIDDSTQCTVDQWAHVLQEFGLKSYISYPIVNKNDAIVGHMSFMNAEPVHLDRNKLETLLPVCSDLIALNFNTIFGLNNVRKELKQELSYTKNRELILTALAHDLNNPVSIVKVISQYLMGSVKDDNQKRLIKKIEEASFRMKGMIDDILDFSSIRLENKPSIINEYCRIDTLIRQILSEYELLHHKKLIANIEVPTEIRCDQHKMGRAFSNLIGNAIKHGNPDKNIEINASIEDGQFIFSVTNDVIFQQHLSDLSNLFEPFTRGSNSKGLGLGLFIAHEIAKLHKGAITVHLDHNTITFKLVIPADFK